MERIKEKPTSVLVPIIDVIEAKNFYYSTNGYDTFQVSDLCDNLMNAKLHQNTIERDIDRDFLMSRHENGIRFLENVSRKHSQMTSCS